jgi:hypothetical protein
MNASVLAALNDAERLLVAQTERAELAALDEDEALARVSRRVAALARQAAAELRAERLAAARAARPARGPGAPGAVPADGRKGPAVTAERTGDRALHSPASQKRRASTRAAGARQQAKRDNR